MGTRARKAVDRAAAATSKAYDALRALSDHIPPNTRDVHQRWVRELGEYADYLSTITWPDHADH